MGRFDYSRRRSHDVNVGGVHLGGDNPVRVQSMANTSTMDTEASVAQALRMAAAGAEYIRFTAQGVREAENLGEIRARLRSAGCGVPLVADIHFNPRAAFAAVEHVEKVRINPGNFADPGRTFRKIDYTDEEYETELQRIAAAVEPFVDKCKAFGTAVRIGVNHGSLSDRIMSRYGDTPAGMVESAMEFLRVCRMRDFNNVVISIKASNVVVMVETVRMLVRAMDKEDMHYPLHLGVTEAGDGEDGRVKSAVGIGTLLAEGVGDTIRVSLSEEPEMELPVARALVDYMNVKASAPGIAGDFVHGYDAVSPKRRRTRAVGNIGGDNVPVVVAQSAADSYFADCRPDFFADDADVKAVCIDAGDLLRELPSIAEDEVIIMSSHHANMSGEISAAFHKLMAANADNPVVVSVRYDGLTAEEVVVRASADCGSLLLNGFADGLMIEGDALTPAESARLAFAILQSTRMRMSRTEYVACPGCGRTLFDLQTTLARVKAATSHLKGLKIGVMGCIVNGPGEMADADYGYVGAAAGRVSLYKGKECVEKNIAAEEAVDRLVALIKKEGDWR